MHGSARTRRATATHRPTGTTSPSTPGRRRLGRSTRPAIAAQYGRHVGQHNLLAATRRRDTGVSRPPWSTRRHLPAAADDQRRPRDVTTDAPTPTTASASTTSPSRSDRHRCARHRPGDKTGTVGTRSPASPRPRPAALRRTPGATTALPPASPSTQTAPISGTPTTAGDQRRRRPRPTRQRRPRRPTPRPSRSPSARRRRRHADRRDPGHRRRPRPLVGQTVTTEGVVTARYPTGGFNGFYIQTPGADTRRRLGRDLRLRRRRRLHDATRPSVTPSR